MRHWIPFCLLLAAASVARAQTPWEQQPLPEEIRALNQIAAETEEEDLRIRRYASAFKACNTNHAAMFALGAYSLTIDNPRSAIRFLSPLAREYPDTPELFLPLAEAHIRLPTPSRKQLQQLERVLTRLAPAHPADPAIPHLLSRLAYRLGQFDAACEQAARACQIATRQGADEDLLAVYTAQLRTARIAAGTFQPVE